MKKKVFLVVGTLRGGGAPEPLRRKKYDKNLMKHKKN